MFSRRAWLVLTIATLMLQNVWFKSACDGQKFANVISFDHYKKLIEIDTGYGVVEKPKLSKEEATAYPERAKDAIQKLYNQLLCCYTFNMFNIMDFLGGHYTKNGKEEFVQLIKNNQRQMIFMKEKCMETLSVLYHFGMLNAMGPIWLVYMFVTYFKSIDVEKIWGERVQILDYYKNYYQRLSIMHTRQNCSTLNRYYNRSKQTNPNSMLNDIKSVGESLEKIYNQIDSLLKIKNNNYEHYFSIDYLKLGVIWKETHLVLLLISEFAEMNGREEMQTRITRLQLKSARFDSAMDVIANVSSAQKLFTNLITFIMLNCYWKYITVINMYLPQIGNEQISDSKKLIDKYVKLIIELFKLKDDSRLTCLTTLIDKPASSFTDVQANVGNKELLFVYMEDICSREYGFELDQVPSPDRVSSKYNEDRLKILKNISSYYKIDYESYIISEMIDKRLHESVVSIFLLYSIMTKVFGSVRFDVIRSFINFSDDFFSVYD